MKKRMAMLLVLVLGMGILGMFSSSLAQEENARQEDAMTELPVIDGVVQDISKYLWEIPEDASKEEYIKLMTRNFRIIQAFELLFTEDSYAEYSKVYSRQFKRTQSYEDAVKVVEAQPLLVQHTSIADGAWFLWGTSEEDNDNGYAWFTGNIGPVVDGEEAELTEEVLDASHMDGYGQGPVLIKCLLDDPSQAKGNIVLISGGGFIERSNPAEGYAAIPCFNALGYNCFLLQRRVAPFSYEDIAMDMQRAIRLVRYYAEQEGWGGQDMIAAAGFSGGGGTIMAAVRLAYGYLTPADEGATSYIPDEIDAVNSDLDVANFAYGVQEWLLYTDDNPNWPATYITYGNEDSVEGVIEGCTALYEMIKDVVPAQIYMVDGAHHGFGVGQSSNVPEACAEWPLQADEFMMAHKGFSTNRGVAEEIKTELLEDALSENSATNAEDSGVPVDISRIPDEYVKAKSFYGFYTFTNSDVFFAMNEEETAFYAAYTVMSHENVIEGTVEDGVVTVTYNEIGFADDDAQLMYEDAISIEDPWEPIVR